MNKMKPYLWGLATILFGIEAFRCTKDAIDMARQGLYWHWGYWAPCCFPLYLLLESFFSKSRKALITSVVLTALVFCYILSLIDYSLSGVCLFLIPGMIILLIYEDNKYLKLMNLITSVMMFLGLFRVSR